MNIWSSEGISYCPGSPAYSVPSPSALCTHPEDGCRGNQRCTCTGSLLPTGQTLNLSTGGMGGVSGLTRLSWAFSLMTSAHPAHESSAHFTSRMGLMLFPLHGESMACTVEIHSQHGLDSGPGVCFFQSFVSEFTHLSESLHLHP